jgi:tetratricopeptide (TPR) repeat protein
MYAKFGRIRGEMQKLPLAEISNEIGTDLNSPLVRNDQRLRLRGLTIKGDIDLEWNVAAAQEDWEQAHRLATELGDRAWEHRATGELGMIAFMRGDTGEARKLVEQAFRAAWWSDDVGAQLRYMGSIANGLLQAGYPESAMGWVDKALAFSQKHPDTGFPYVVRSTQALALLRLNRAAEAERVINDALVYAKAGDRRIKQSNCS